MSINNYILKSDQIFCANQQDVINGYIIIHDNRIHAVEKGYIPSSLENQYTVYDLSGKTILPGFFDAHTFFTGWSKNMRASLADVVVFPEPSYGN